MKALLVGCGAMANGWAKAIREDSLLAGRVDIAGLVDIDQERLGQFASDQNLEDKPRFSDVRDALDAVETDVVFDVTPPFVRADVVRAGLRAGKHVLSEKPMASSMAEARELTELAGACGRTFAVTQTRRFFPGIRRVGAFLRTGAIGTVTGVHADFFLGPHFGGFREEMDHVLLLDMAIHTFDGARFLAREDARRVYCVETNPPGSWYAHGASAFATFELESGTVFSYRGSWCAEGMSTAWDSAWRITGSKGAISWDGEGDIDARVGTGPMAFFRETERLDVPELEDDSRTRGHASAIAEFVDAVSEGRQPEIDCVDNFNSIAMVFAAIESANSGEPIDVPGLEKAANRPVNP